MNKVVLFPLLIMSIVTGSYVFAQKDKSPAKAPVAEASELAAPTNPDEEIIRDAVVAFVKQYEAHNAEELAALFADDARMVFADGDEVNGREEIKQSFEEEFQTNPKAAISVVVDSIRFLTPGVAVEEGTTNLFPDGETLTSAGRYTVLHLKKDDRWLMQSVRVVQDEAVSSYGQLQPLEWLLGDWIDEGADEVVEANFRWDENKSFLLEEFQIIQQGEVVLKGTQRIGWDPQAKQVRSWIFDSAGGFGEATWTQVGDDWICKGKGVAANGASSSATRTLNRAAADRVIWSSTDRFSEGEQLPDIAVTMVRQPPEPEVKD